MKSGDVSAVKRMKENTTVEDRFRPDNCQTIYTCPFAIMREER